MQNAGRKGPTDLKLTVNSKLSRCCCCPHSRPVWLHRGLCKPSMVAMQTQYGGMPQQQTWSRNNNCTGRNARLSGHGTGALMLLLPCAFWQASCLPGLVLFSMGLSPQKGPETMCAKPGSRSGGAALMGKPMISCLWKTLIHLRPACDWVESDPLGLSWGWIPSLLDNQWPETAIIMEQKCWVPHQFENH